MAKIEPSAWQVSKKLDEFQASQVQMINGLGTSRPGLNGILVQPGSATAENGLEFITLLAAMNKNVDSAWVAGDGNGGLDTGSIANTTYHIFVISNPTTGATDVLISASTSNPTLPLGYTLFRRLASIIRSANIVVNYHQFEDDFFWNVPSAHAISGIPNNASFGVQIPAGPVFLVKGIISAGRAGGTNGDKALSVTSPLFSNFNAASAPDTSTFRGHTGSQFAASSFSADMKGGSSYFESMSNTTSQIRIDGTGTSSANGVLQVIGWRDFRGKL